jgi:hypothetical protein
MGRRTPGRPCSEIQTAHYIVLSTGGSLKRKAGLETSPAFYFETKAESPSSGFLGENA